MKIKTKKKLTLPELIQWGWKNGVTKSFYGSGSGKVVFGHVGWVSSTLISQNETFEVEVEEEIDENTKIPVLVEVAKLNENSEDIRIYYYRGISISEAKSNIIVSKVFYMLNDDMTMTLLWKGGEMVE
ncbi:hypothetical protein K2V56_10480 [Staphylococcus chromogenes]|uniref:hypothetical protein n=1 Tax=Staphylococcus chromogenes TaxID=46126 RepID=UPI001E32593A|nr:hypothetical protein [Staphylococcus chromogenes]MCD8905909.1 hypothetical protein [Staphylococcus chromogenes]